MADQVSDTRIVAPADYQERETSHQDDMSSWRAGPGWATDRACGRCGNRDGNLEIFESWWVSRNGDARENHEIRCARCGTHSLYIVEL